MSSSQRTSSSQASQKKVITSKVYQKTICCVFLKQFDPTTINSESDLESRLTQIEVSVDVSVFGNDDGLDTANVSSAILKKLNENYPGIEEIDLYLHGEKLLKNFQSLN